MTALKILAEYFLVGALLVAIFCVMMLLVAVEGIRALGRVPSWD